DAEARFYLGVDVTRFEDVAGKGAKQVRFDEVETAPATRYAAERADVALQLHEHLWSRLGETGSLMALYREIEQPLACVLLRMEQHGVLIDREMLRIQSAELEDTMRRL